MIETSLNFISLLEVISMKKPSFSALCAADKVKYLDYLARTAKLKALLG